MKKLFKLAPVLFLMLCSSFSFPLLAQDFTIQTLDTVREYRVHLPNGYDANNTYPLLLAFHGGLGFNWQFENETGFSDLADTSELIVVYPQAIGTTRSWNTGSCCGWAFNNNINDVSFIDLLLDSLIADYSIDEDRIYSTGFSSGAMMSYALACKLSGRFAAIAPVSSSMIVDQCPTECLPLPVVHVHAAPDSSALFYGGVSNNPLLNFYYPPVDSVLDVWATKNASLNYKDTVFFGNGARHVTWYNDSNDGLVQLWWADDGGHKWPGTSGTGIISGDSATQDFYATPIVWEFLQQYSHSCELTLHTNNADDFLSVTVYPNPTRDVLTFELDKKYVNLNASLYNLNGELLNSVTNESSMPIETLEGGMYILEVVADGAVFLTRVVKI